MQPMYSWQTASSVQAQVSAVPQQNKAYECIGLGPDGHHTTIITLPLSGLMHMLMAPAK